MSLNLVQIIGNLGRAPELRYTNGGTPVASLNVATTRHYKTSDGEPKEETEWHRVTVWGKQAQQCHEHLDKGRQVYVSGRLQTRSYEKDGETRYSTDIVADRVTFLGSPSGGRKNEPPPPTDDDIPF